MHARPCHRPCLDARLLRASFSPPSAAFGQTRPDLRGSVTDATGAPIRGATVIIYITGPKKGTSPL